MGLGRGGACIQCTTSSGICCRYIPALPPLTPGMCLFAATPGDPPVDDAPLHVTLFKENPASKNDEAAKEVLVSIGAGLPPVPRKLVMRIQAGDYIDMAELLPERWLQQTAAAPKWPLVNEEACAIHTPLVVYRPGVDSWQATQIKVWCSSSCVACLRDSALGLAHLCSSSALLGANISSALEHPEVVDRYLQNEVAL